MNFLLQVRFAEYFDHPPSLKSQMVQSLHHLWIDLSISSCMAEATKQWATLLIFDITGYPGNSIFISMLLCAIQN